MMEAPTKEIAIGMKMSDLGSDSRRMRSMSSARIRPTAVEKIGVMIQIAVLRRKTQLASVPKIHW